MHVLQRQGTNNGGNVSVDGYADLSWSQSSSYIWHPPWEERTMLIAEWCFSERGLSHFNWAWNAIVVSPPVCFLRLFTSKFRRLSAWESARSVLLKFSICMLFDNQRQTPDVINSKPLSLNVLGIWWLSLLVHIQCSSSSMGSRLVLRLDMLHPP